MLNKDFLELLEYQLTKALTISQNSQLKGFWCDGILLPSENEKKLLKTKQVLMTAFLGKDGQDKYDLTLKFGVNSLNNYANCLSLFSCVPNPDMKDWFNIDVSSKTIIVQLL